MSAKRKPRKLATVKDPAIAAALGERFRLPDEQAAVDKLAWLKDRFITSRREPEEELKRPALLMWIRGYDVSRKQEQEGYFGHFALISYKKLADGSYTLFPTKIEMELTQHPERRYGAKRQQHPNWGHPLLREIKKGLIYPNPQEAYARLELLHREYPNASIPGDNKLYLMVFSRAEPGKKPLQKYVFEIKPVGDTDCRIEWRENTYNPSSKPKGPKKLVGASADGPVGYFTTRVSLSKRKRRAPVVKPTKAEE